MTIDEAKRFIEGQARQNQVGNVTISQLNAYFKRAQLEIVNNLVGNIEEYQPGRPLPQKSFEVTSVISDDLANLVAASEFPMTAGVAPKPADYMYLIPPMEASVSTPASLSWTPVMFTTHGEKSMMLNSQINYPESDNPIAVNYNTFFQVYPNNIPRGRLTYIRKPADPVWGYTTVNSSPVYNSGTSQNFELPEAVHMKICQKVLEYYGISIRDEELIASAFKKLKEGT
jgi:hypothetical protein